MLSLIPQKRHNECHIGAVMTFLSGFVDGLDYKQIKKELKNNRLIDLEDCILQNGVDVKCYQFEKEKLHELNFTVMIAHIQNSLSSHYVVIEKDFNKLYYYDPANYKRHEVDKKIIKQLSGFCISTELEPKKEIKITFSADTFHPDSRYMLCSDGFYKQCDLSEFCQAIFQCRNRTEHSVFSRDRKICCGGRHPHERSPRREGCEAR